MTTVTWKVKRQESIPCPDYQADPYTGSFPNTMCAVAHFKVVEEEKVKKFNTKEEAEQFIKDAPKADIFGNGCTNFNLSTNE